MPGSRPSRERRIMVSLRVNPQSSSNRVSATSTTRPLPCEPLPKQAKRMLGEKEKFLKGALERMKPYSIRFWLNSAFALPEPTARFFEYWLSSLLYLTRSYDKILPGPYAELSYQSNSLASITG